MASKTSTKPVGIQCEPVLGVRNVYKYSKKGSTTEAYVIDRESLSKSIPIKELQYPGIYFLIGDALDGSDIRNVYVGKAGLHNSKNKDENQAILGRLRQHDTSKTESYRDLWKFAVAITQYSVEKTSGSTAELYGSWGLTEVSNLENIFYHNLPSNCKLNSAEPNLGSDFRDNTDYSGLVTQIKELLVASGSIDFDEGVNLQETGVYDAAEQVEPVEQKEQVGNSESVKTTVKESAVTTNINPLASVPEYTTPKKTVRQVEDCINPELLNPNTTFIDLACKGGEFLKELYNRLMQAESLIAEFPNEMERSVHILSNQLYGVALSNVSADKARRNLLGYGKNIVTIPNYISILKASYGTAARRAKQLGLIYEHTDIKDVLKGLFKTESGDPVKFDVVIGNPPYQEATASIYDKFIDIGIDMADKQVCMITKNNWLVSETMSNIRDKMIKNGLKDIINYPVVREVFSNVTPCVSIFNIDKHYSGEVTYSEIAGGVEKKKFKADFSGIGMITTDKRDAVIIEHIMKSIETLGNFGHHTFPVECFRINSNCTVGRGFRTYDLEAYAKPTAEATVTLMMMHNDYEPYFLYIKPCDIPSRAELANQWKIVCGRIFQTNGKIISNIRGLPPVSVSSSSWGVIFASSDKDEAIKASKYIQTRLFRYLVSLRLSDGLNGITEARFKFVPDLAQLNWADIGVDDELCDVEDKLYKLFGLDSLIVDASTGQTAAEFINSTVEKY